MRLAGSYSHRYGAEAVTGRFRYLFEEVKTIIDTVPARSLRSASVNKRPRANRALYSPRVIDRHIQAAFRVTSGWRCVQREYASPADHRRDLSSDALRPLREMGYVKERLGVHASFLTPFAAVCSVCAHMTIFNKLGHIDCGIEIVPVKAFAEDMSSGVSYFEQFVWDLETRGTADIDIPVLVLGIDE